MLESRNILNFFDSDSFFVLDMVGGLPLRILPLAFASSYFKQFVLQVNANAVSDVVFCAGSGLGGVRLGAGDMLIIDATTLTNLYAYKVNEGIGDVELDILAGT